MTRGLPRPGAVRPGHYWESDMAVPLVVYVRLFLATTCLGGFLFAPLGAVRATDDDKITVLLKERLVALQAIATLAEKAHAAGTGTFDKVVAARLAVFAAELDLCATDAERAKVLEKVVAETKRLEADAKKAAALEGTVLAAKVRRLEAEIALERLRAKPSQSAP